MPPSVIQFLAKYAFQIVAVIIVICAYFAWAHHQQTLGEERVKAEVAKRDAKTAKDSAELMATEKAKVEQSKTEQNERLLNAITIYAQRSTDLNDDVANLTKRMRDANTPASCSKNTVPGTDNDNAERKGRDNEADYDIASAAIKLANLCEKVVNEIPVKK